MSKGTIFDISEVAIIGLVVLFGIIAIVAVAVKQLSVQTTCIEAGGLYENNTCYIDNNK